MDEKQFFLSYKELQSLLLVLQKKGYQCVGPQVKEASIVYDDIENITQLPWGYQEKQSPGHYELQKTSINKAFLWANGPQAIKPFLFKPSETVWRVKRNEAGKIEFIPENKIEKPIALLGARACDIAGMLIQDRALMHDKQYQMRRESLFIIGVNCVYASKNCFCVSAGTGPEIKNQGDLVMTEIDAGFVIYAVSLKGNDILNSLKLKRATKKEIDTALQERKKAETSQIKKIPFNNSNKLYDLLFSNLDHPRWKEVAERCLSCGNCVQVCPTCFCHHEFDEPELSGENSEHKKVWDTCFARDHSYMVGKIVRDTTEKRYKQWLTHKVGSWHKQFDTSGCVGCGRCITWCPVGIDLTEELAAIAGENKNE